MNNMDFHRSYLVNKTFIKAYSKKEQLIILKDGTKLAISRRRRIKIFNDSLFKNLLPRFVGEIPFRKTSIISSRNNRSARYLMMQPNIYSSTLLKFSHLYCKCHYEKIIAPLFHNKSNTSALQV